MTAGRPLRFLVAVLVGWIALRALWPGANEPAGAPVAASEDDGLGWYRDFRRRYPIDPPLFDLPPMQPYDPGYRLPKDQRKREGQAPRSPIRPGPTPPRITSQPPTAPPPAPAAPEASGMPPPPVPIPGVLSPFPPPATTSRWSGSGWAILRGGGAGPDFAGGRLGAAQAGLRLTYALGQTRRWAVAARVSSPIEGRGREAALGLEWRPTRLPLRLLAEQRVGLDRGVRSGPALSLIGGVDRVPVAAGFRLEGYAQGGVARIGAFADGGARLARPVGEVAGLALDLGVGAWGGAQPGAARLDVGPSATLLVPLADARVRIGLEWRRRVAGLAAPGSGPALTIGSDF